MSHARVPVRRQMLGETRLLMEYLQQAYPGLEWRTNVKLGNALQPRSGLTLTESEKRLLIVYQRYADAVVISSTELVVIEATIFRTLDKVGPLLQYVALVPHTTELKPFLNRPIVGELLTAVPDAVAQNLAAKAGLRFRVFQPDWLEEFYAIYPSRIRRSPAPGTVQLD